MITLKISKEDWIKESCCEFINLSESVCYCGSESSISVCTKEYSQSCRYAIEKRKQDKNND
jgi:hypothetical protein